MTEKDSQGGKWGFWKKALVMSPFLILALVIFFLAVSTIYSPIASANTANNTANNIVNNAPDPLSLAVWILTILVTIVAIIMGGVTLWTRSDWNKFKEETWKDANKRLNDLEESQKDIKYLKEHIETDPLLLDPEDIKQLFDFADGIRSGQDMLALKFYFGGRAYEIGYGGNLSSKEDRLEKSIWYYKNALGYDMSPETKRRIYQAMGTSESGLGEIYSEKGPQSKAKECYKKAVHAFDDAFKAKHNSQALDSQGNAHIELAKMASANQEEEEKAKQLGKAIECFYKAIQMNDKLARQWWATYHLDKARALALRADKDKREDLNEVVEELKKAINAVDKEPVGFDVSEPFHDFENVKDDDEIKRLLDHLQLVVLKARLKGD